MGPPQEGHSQRFQAGGRGRGNDTSRRWVLSQGLRPGGSGSQLGWGILRRVALGVKASLEGGPSKGQVGVLVRDSSMLHQGSLRGHQARYEDICGGYDWGVLLASSGWGPICIGHRPASQSPIQNLLGLFGSKAKAGTSQETDITGRPSPEGWGSKSAAQMAPRCGHPHGVGGTVKATTTSAQTPGPAAGSLQPWPFPTPSQACQGHGSWSPAPGM